MHCQLGGQARAPIFLMFESCRNSWHVSPWSSVPFLPSPCLFFSFSALPFLHPLSQLIACRGSSATWLFPVSSGTLVLRYALAASPPRGTMRPSTNPRTAEGGRPWLIHATQTGPQTASVLSLFPAVNAGFFSACRQHRGGRPPCLLNHRRLLLGLVSVLTVFLSCLPFTNATVSPAALQDVCYAFGNISRKLSSFLVPSRVTCPRGATLLSGVEAQDSLEHPDIPDFRFLVYDVKNGEGFHLQKEVIYRVALVISLLNARSAQQGRMTDVHTAEKAREDRGHPQASHVLCASSSFSHACSARSTFPFFPMWVLVLPPWCRLAHWHFSEETITAMAENSWLKHVRWGTFFDFQDLGERLPVMEYEDFLTYQLMRPDPWGERRQRKEKQTTPVELDVVLSVRFSSTPSSRSLPFCACLSSRASEIADEQAQTDDVCCNVNDLPGCPQIHAALTPEERQRAPAQRGGDPREEIDEQTGEFNEGHNPSGDGEREKRKPGRRRDTSRSRKEIQEEAKVSDTWSGVSLWLAGFCETVRALEMWCASLYIADAPRIADLLWRSVAERPPGAIQTVWLKFGENLLVPWPDVLLDAHLLDMLHVHPKLRQIGDLFINKLLSNRDKTEAGKGERASTEGGTERDENLAKHGYIAAHLRRTDFLYLKRSVPLQRAAAYLVSRMKEHGVFKAFICTDGSEDEKRELRDAVRRVGDAASSSPYTVVFFDLPTVRRLMIKTLEASSHVSDDGSFHDLKAVETPGYSGPNHISLLLHPGITALIEVWIAARAAYFIGTKDSRFSQAIRWERHLMGHPLDSSLEVFCVDSSPDQTGGQAQGKCFATKSHDPPEGRSRSELRRKYWPSLDPSSTL
ncbi:GDP-fucose protein O-fucosyltransferase [Toxoplasma gondii p89]|uniref:GDP-fucose protein O-fucosyltransferase 2 n=1 Tax=Toxoplasma gondii p89 TaxID=943119 RepID=A0A086L4S2_TOXGO|nr:GDP-fucose protein O-fucosyltransferase [Toxoplasma gondii p89]